ncbi:MAG: hypothetical protein KatS3mg060_1031 [Dehalococcoidia bacterium]|nr:MAG: hypothetical protein KatS3mg060_1031 [Dehalococcoidia bacterium]
MATPEARLGLLIVVGTIPAVVIGALVQGLAESTLRDPRLTAGMLILFSGVMWLAERAATQKRTLLGLRLPDALVVGTAQAIALVPGVSRSGITIATGLFRGIRRADAARFSFLLAAPVTFGAVVLETAKLARSGHARRHGSRLRGQESPPLQSLAFSASPFSCASWLGSR